MDQEMFGYSADVLIFINISISGPRNYANLSTIIIITLHCTPLQLISNSFQNVSEIAGVYPWVWRVFEGFGKITLIIGANALYNGSKVT